MASQSGTSQHFSEYSMRWRGGNKSVAPVMGQTELCFYLTMYVNFFMVANMYLILIFQLISCQKWSGRKLKLVFCKYANKYSHVTFVFDEYQHFGAHKGSIQSKHYVSLFHWRNCSVQYCQAQSSPISTKLGWVYPYFGFLQSSPPPDKYRLSKPKVLVSWNFVWNLS